LELEENPGIPPGVERSRIMSTSTAERAQPQELVTAALADLEERKRLDIIINRGLTTEREAGFYAAKHGVLLSRSIHTDVCHCRRKDLRLPKMLKEGDVIEIAVGDMRVNSAAFRRLKPEEIALAVSLDAAAMLHELKSASDEAEGEVHKNLTAIRHAEDLKTRAEAEIAELKKKSEVLGERSLARSRALEDAFKGKPKGWRERAMDVASELISR